MNSQTGKLSRGGLEHEPVCDICNHYRNRGDHQACSRTRQARYRSLRETETVQQRGVSHE